MLWGMTSGGWMSGLTAHAEDEYRAQIALLAEYGLHATSWRAAALMEMEPARRDEIAELLREHDVSVGLGVGVDLFSDDRHQIEERTRDAVRAVRTLAGLMRTKVCHTGINRRFHHYSRDLPVAEQIDILSETMAPLAAACAEEGCPLVVHKVAHFGSDLAELCKRVPGLGILLDTANCFLVGEPPLTAARACAPYTYATHFKDSYVSPSFSPMALRVRGAVPGSGDARLRETYRILMEDAPEPDGLVMQFEIDPVQSEDGEPRPRSEVLKEAVEFAQSL